MSTKPIDVKIIDSTPNFITVKLPFLDIPVKMNHELFNKRMESGYFQISGLSRGSSKVIES